MEKDEQWKNIENYGSYQVSNLGNIKSLGFYVRKRNGGYYFRAGKLLSECYGSSGYSLVRLSNKDGIKTFNRHRLVAEAFVPNPDNLPQVNHIDGDKSHNYDSNLEWVTASDNIMYAYDHGIRKERKPIRMYDLSGNFLRYFTSGNEVERTLNIYRSGVCEACQGKKSGENGNEYHGFIWRYA